MYPDQVALITGGGRGLGRAFAGALAQAGARVAVTARSEAELTETVELIRQIQVRVWIKNGGSDRTMPGEDNGFWCFSKVRPGTTSCRSSSRRTTRWNWR